MESNGIRGKIQISQDTADYLISNGKSSWITKRADVIVAKGKGEMQTYWLNADSPSKSTVGTEDTSEISFSEIEASGNATLLSSEKISSLVCLK